MLKTIKLLFIFSLLINNIASATNSIPINCGAKFEVGFSPNENSLQIILKSISEAKKSIYVAAYSFTSKPIAMALLNARKRGIDVKVVADKKSNLGKYSAITFLANNKIPVRLNGNYAIFHNKFMVIDGKNLETGSFNYSAAANNKNAENVLLLTNAPEIAKIYEIKWQKLWNEAQPISAKY